MHVRSFIEIRADLGKIPSLSTTIGGNLQVLVHKFLGALTPPCQPLGATCELVYIVRVPTIHLDALAGRVYN